MVCMGLSGVSTVVHVGGLVRVLLFLRRFSRDDEGCFADWKGVLLLDMFLILSNMAILCYVYTIYKLSLSK